jgi:hypothetical protein
MKYCNEVIVLSGRDGIAAIIANMFNLRSADSEYILFSINDVGTENSSNVTRIVSLSIKLHSNS